MITLLIIITSSTTILYPLNYLLTILFSLSSISHSLIYPTIYPTMISIAMHKPISQPTLYRSAPSIPPCYIYH
jgi:hypothetical protein